MSARVITSRYGRYAKINLVIVLTPCADVRLREILAATVASTHALYTAGLPQTSLGSHYAPRASCSTK